MRYIDQIVMNARYAMSRAIWGEQKEALDMAIKALEQQPCEDAIRKAMIDINKHATKESDKVTKNDFPQERDESIFNVEVIKNGKGDLKEIEAYLDKYAHNRYAIKAVENIKSGKDYRDNNHD